MFDWPGSRPGLLEVHAPEDSVMNSQLVWNRSWGRSANGGSPRIHAGELGFQAERLAWKILPAALAAGFPLEMLRGWIDFRL